MQVNSGEKTWRIIDSGICDAAYAMALDEAIATAVRAGASRPTLRLYDWTTSSVSIGAFQKISDVDTEYCTTRGIPVVRRPTGGRAILHGDEITLSFSSTCEKPFSRDLMDTYRLLGGVFREFFRRLDLDVEIIEQRDHGTARSRNPLCFSSLSPGELRCRGRKVMGAAQRRWGDGFLQQATIPLTPDRETAIRVFSLPNLSGVQGPAGLRELVPHIRRRDVKTLLTASFEAAFTVILEESPPSPQEEELAHRLALEKYLDPRWTLRGERGGRSSDSMRDSMQASQY
ncbi:MAG: biotin/lipoate A/B protein ligase family protein [Chloroflexota bacterium]